MPRLHFPCLAVERAHHDVSNRARPRVGLQVHRVGVQDDPHAAGVDEVLRARRAEALALLVEAPQTRGEPVGIERVGHDTQRRPDVVLVVELAQLELRMRDAVVWIEVRAANRPSAVRHPVATLEIDGIEQRAAAAPDAHRASEETQP